MANDRILQMYWEEFIVDIFLQTSKNISQELANFIALKMKNHPYYVQQLSHYVWKSMLETVSEKTVELALNRMLDTDTALYQMEFDNLSNTQIELVKAITAGEMQLTSLKVMQKYRVGTLQNIQKNMKSLENKDIIDKNNKKIEIIDPVFDLWFNKITL